jgi:hypothetical protein
MLMPVLAAVACLATPVQTSVGGATSVKAGPFVGALTREYDVVGGRFSLHAGPYRVPGGLTQKIPWFVQPGHGARDSLTVTGTRLTKPVRRFTQQFARAYASGERRVVFPSIVNPPSPGCWRLTLRSGTSTGVITVLVRRVGA